MKGILATITVLMLFVSAQPAIAQKADDNIFHPISLFDRLFSRTTAAQADCAISMTKELASGKVAISANRSLIDGTEETAKEREQQFLAFYEQRRTSAEYPCWRDVKRKAASTVLGVYKTYKKTGSAVTSDDFLSQPSNDLEDLILSSLGLEAIRSHDEREILFYGVSNRLLFEKIYARNTILPKADDAGKTFEAFVAKAICGEAPGDASGCKPAKDKAASFRRTLERVYYEHQFNQDRYYESDTDSLGRPKARTKHKDLEYIRIHGLFVENLRAPAALEEKVRPQEGFNYKSLPDCTKDPINLDAGRAKIVILRSVLNCQVPGSPDYRILLAYKPGSSSSNFAGQPQLAPGVPREPRIISVRNKTQAIVSDTFQSVGTRFPSEGAFRFAKDPSEFLKSETEEGVTISLTLDNEDKQETLEFDAALGYRLSNTVKPADNCDRDSSTLCNWRLQVSATPFIAWQSKQVDTFSEGTTETDTERDTLFAGIQLGAERIPELASNEQHADYWKRPSWRSSLALEAITDEGFDAEVYRAVFLMSPPLSDTVPNLGYRQRVRLGDLPLSHERHRDLARRDQGEIRRCRTLVLCSIWLEWDFSGALEEIVVETAPLDLKSDVAGERLDLFGGSRFGYDVSAAIGARSPFAFRADKPWLELSVDYKNRQSFREGGGQAELLDVGLDLKDTFDGLFSFGVGYERGEDLRLGDEIETWKFSFDIKQ